MHAELDESATPMERMDRVTDLSTRLLVVIYFSCVVFFLVLSGFHVYLLFCGCPYEILGFFLVHYLLIGIFPLFCY